MRRGLVIGKFMPLHLGHMALIRFAASRCDELIVSMSYTDHDPIDGPVRYGWIQEVFADDSKILVRKLIDDFDDESLSLEARTTRWTAKMKQVYPPIDVIFSSEAYGAPFAYSMNAVSEVFDQQRVRVPVSGSAIRNNPGAFWDFIPDHIKYYFVKKVCLYGPESTGKSTMAKYMAEHYHTVSVPEVSREFLSNNDFTLEDIIRIGKAQTERIHHTARLANRVMFCDTDLITTEIYCRHYLKTIPDILFELEREVSFDRYFLMDIDVPWVADGLRDLGDRRKEMFEVFRNELDLRKIPYILVSGDWDQRREVIRREVDKIIMNSGK